MGALGAGSFRGIKDWRIEVEGLGVGDGHRGPGLRVKGNSSVLRPSAKNLKPKNHDVASFREVAKAMRAPLQHLGVLF